MHSLYPLINSMFVLLLLMTIVLLMVIVDAHHEVIHPKGNSIIYDERAIPFVDNFDFKRIPQSLSSSSSSSSMRDNQNPTIVMSESGSHSSSSYPKSINDKIKSVLVTSATSETADRERFYQQVIPKLTSMIFSTRPSILNNNEETVVQYRSPTVTKMLPSNYPPPTVPTIRLNSLNPSHRSMPSTSTMTKRMIDPKTMQIITNLPPQQQQPWRPMQSKQKRVHKKLPIITATTPIPLSLSSSPSPPRETYMTLSFEESSSKDEPKTYSSNESRYYLQQQHRQQHYGRKAKEPLSSSMMNNPKRNTQQRQQGRRSIMTSSMPNSKVMTYYQQSFRSTDPMNSSSGSILKESNEQQPHRSSFKSSRHQSSSPPQSSMALTFHDPNGAIIRSSQASSSSSSMKLNQPTTIDDQQFDWKKSISKYAKEFGFETPFWNQMDTSNGANDDEYDSGSSSSNNNNNMDNDNHSDNDIYSRQPSISTISFANDVDSYYGSRSPLRSGHFIQNDESSNDNDNNNNNRMMTLSNYPIPADLFSGKTNAHQNHGESSLSSSSQTFKDEIDQLLNQFYGQHSHRSSS
ncbi:uncharacterized protein LOC124500541 [Dermatophagoides farinae]|uniref:uncharacterized protein LOC124500541 n=1 Tax=Dermatophagoides farinae TaxID=6954 RepID=UPI003F616DBD